GASSAEHESRAVNTETARRTVADRPRGSNRMSKHETPMIREYWRRVGGMLLEEYPAVARSASCGPRRLDAIILPTGEHRISSWRDVSLEGQDVIVVQAKASRLGMYLMGQALFSVELVRKFKPASIRSVILCGRDDAVLRPLLAAHPSVELVVL